MFRSTRSDGGRRRRSSNGRRSGMAAGAAIVATVIALTAGPAPADASALGTGTVNGTEGIGLNVRPGPSTSSGGPVGLLPEGTEVTIDCYADGETVAGYWYTSSLWQHITAPVNGYVSDTYLYTGVDGPIEGVPACDGAPVSAPPADPVPGSGHTVSGACGGLADIDFKPGSHQVAVTFSDATAQSIVDTGYTCLAKEVVEGYEYDGAHQYWGWVENEIRNHAFAWTLHLNRGHANPADIDFDAYAQGPVSWAAWQWDIDYHETGAPLRLFAGG